MHTCKERLLRLKSFKQTNTQHGPKSTNWDSAEYQCNNCPRFIDYWAGWSILLWPWVVFFHTIGCDWKQGKTDYKSDTRTSGFRNGKGCSRCRMGWCCHWWIVRLARDRVDCLLHHCILIWFLISAESNKIFAETSSILANRLLLPAGPKSWTEEDLRWMCRIEHCRKDGGEPKASRNFGIF